MATRQIHALLTVAFIAGCLLPATAWSQPQGVFPEDVYYNPAAVAAPAPVPVPPVAPPAPVGPGAGAGAGVGGIAPVPPVLPPAPPVAPPAPPVAPPAPPVAPPAVPPAPVAPPAGVPPLTLTGCPANGIRGEIDQELRVYSYDDPTLEYRPMATTRSARLLTTLPAAGYYHVYTLNPADSGGWQVNESLALRVRNTQNALGNPIYTNCLNKWVLQDPDNGRPVALGTQFYAGTFIFDTTDNIFQVSHYCPVYRTGECQDLHTVREPRASCDSPYPGDHSVTDNSVELYPQSFCLIPAN